MQHIYLLQLERYCLTARQGITHPNLNITTYQQQPTGNINFRLHTLHDRFPISSVFVPFLKMWDDLSEFYVRHRNGCKIKHGAYLLESTKASTGHGYEIYMSLFERGLSSSLDYEKLQVHQERGEVLKAQDHGVPILPDV